MSFLPDGYVDPSTAKDYIKPSDLAEGSHKFRILSTPVMGWCYWVDDGDKRKPVRVKDFKDIPENFRAPADDKDKAYYFWSVFVWNYTDDRAQIMEIKQSTVRAELQMLDSDPDIGDVREYDIKLIKSGQKKDSKYKVNALQKEKFETKDKNIPEVNLEALFDGKDPFDTGATTKEQDDKLLEGIDFDGGLGLDKSNP